MAGLLQECQNENCRHPLEEHDWGDKSINNACLVVDCACQGFVADKITIEAEDTVMTHKQMVECSHNPVQELREKDIREAQADISFKAGIEKGIREERERILKTYNETIAIVPEAGLAAILQALKEADSE